MTIKISLSPIRKDQLNSLREWRNEYEVRRWCRQLYLISEEEHLRWFEKQAVDPSMKMFSIVYTREDNPWAEFVAGACGLTSIDLINRRAEFSLYIGPEHQKMGVGEEALRELLKFGFNTMGLNLIWGESFDKNPALKMFYRVGFKQEGVRQQFYYKDGKFIDATLVSITKNQYLWRHHDDPTRL